MSERTDPMFYEFDIREAATGETRRVPIFCWWSGQASIDERRRMCDCQLGAYFNAPPQDLNTYTDLAKGRTTNVLARCQYPYLKQHSCDHTQSKKFQAVRAYLPDGEVVEIAEAA